jgi:bifunctional ADP-heptose synthase (sugar kinase/adenylyltransferase)
LAYHSAEELRRLIRLLKPDIVCRGDDQMDFIGKEEAEEVGAEIVYFPYSKDISSTKIKERVCLQASRQQKKL